MSLRSREKRGMALVIVLAFALAMLTLGTAYMRTFSEARPVNAMIMERLQADYFAQGIQRIALLKYKRFVADFYHAYIYRQAGLTGFVPDPYSCFLGGDNTPLQNFQFGGATIGAPVSVATYSSYYLMTSYKGYNRDGLVIHVTVQVKDFVQNYDFTIDASRTRLL